MCRAFSKFFPVVGLTEKEMEQLGRALDSDQSLASMLRWVSDFENPFPMLSLAILKSLVSGLILKYSNPLVRASRANRFLRTGKKTPNSGFSVKSPFPPAQLPAIQQRVR